MFIATVWGDGSAVCVLLSASCVRTDGVADAKITGEEVVAAQSVLQRLSSNVDIQWDSAVCTIIQYYIGYLRERKQQSKCLYHAVAADLFNITQPKGMDR